MEIKKLRCLSCAGEWYIENDNIDRMNFCPYCAERIREKAVIGEIDSLDKAIYKAISDYGEDVLSNPSRLMGILRDLAPHDLEKEVRIFSRAFTGEYLLIYKNIFAYDISNAEKELLKIKHMLIENDGLAESWAEMLYQNCLRAVMYTKGSGLPDTMLAEVTDVAPAKSAKRSIAGVLEGTAVRNSYAYAFIDSITFLDSLDDMPEDARDVSKDGSGSVLAWLSVSQNTNSSDLFIAANGEIGVSNCRKIFADYKNLKKIEFNGIFNTSQTTDMSGMFEGCRALEELDLSGFDTSQVTDMSYMFHDCKALKKLDLGRFDTSQAITMNGMFLNCFALNELDLSGFDTSQVKNMFGMFLHCFALEKLDLSSFDTSQVTDMSLMFGNCYALKKLDLSNFDTSRVTNKSGMFSGCPAF